MDFFSWLPWLTGGGVVTLIVIAVLAPSVLQVAASWLSALSPLIKGAAEGIVELAKALWAGLLDMVDNGKSILFVGVVAGLGFVYGYYLGGQKDCRVGKVESKQVTVPAPTKKPTTNAVEDFFKNLGLPF